MDDLITEFLTETNESLGELDSELVRFEQDPNDTELISSIFRLMHTIKGTCGFLGLPRLEKVAHHAENVLGRFRDGDLAVTPNYVTLIFNSIDRIKIIIQGIEDTGSEPEGDDAELIEQLDIVFEGREAPTDSVAAPATEEPVIEITEEPVVTEEVAAAPEPEVAPEITETPPPAPSAEAELEEAAKQSEAMKKAEAIKRDLDKQQKAKLAAQPAAEAAKGKPVSQQSLRVNVDVLEDLMTMVSELVLTRNQLLQILRVQKESEFSAPLQRLNHVVSELQEGVMKTRMQPIGNAWAKLPRIIRDITMDLGKKIELEMRGKDTELDRQVLDMIKDPLTHMVRNSADHGVEMPEDRLAIGKPETGKILLNAFHEGGHIIIQISDDGKGLSVDKIKEKAVANGIATADELDEMPNQQLYQFIFKAGFSTAEKVTSVSGRGVGMDVVRTNIEKIGGSIELTSEEGKGSTFTIKIPLTLAIVSALIVEVSGERFAIPQIAVRELVMASAQSEHKIEEINGAPVLRLRDHLLPLVSLRRLLNLNRPEDLLMEGDNNEQGIIDINAKLNELKHATEKGDKNEAVESQKEASADVTKLETNHRYIVVAQVGSYSFGIIVDRVFDTEEIVVKPVAKMLRDIEMFSGNTILGDGSVIMILDPAGIAKSSGQADTSKSSGDISEERHKAAELDKTTLLLFKAGKGAPRAVPLSLVSRLENINFADVEAANGQMIIQYRGQLMPLEPFDASTQINSEEQNKPVLVFTEGERSMGLIVDEIIDIVEEHINVQLEGSNQGIIGSAIIKEKATDVIDVAYYVRKGDSSFFKQHDDKPFSNEQLPDDAKKVLLVDDSPFFRNMLTPLLAVAGYRVTTVESPLEALELCENGETFDVIVSDIEMPEMDGFEFAQKVKSESLWKDTPMVALTSHATPQDVDRGQAVGFNEYIAKFDRDTLLSTLSQTLSSTLDANKEAS